MKSSKIPQPQNGVTASCETGKILIDISMLNAWLSHVKDENEIAVEVVDYTSKIADINNIIIQDVRLRFHTKINAIHTGFVETADKIFYQEDFANRFKDGDNCLYLEAGRLKQGKIIRCEVFSDGGDHLFSVRKNNGDAALMKNSELASYTTTENACSQTACMP